MQNTPTPFNEELYGQLVCLRLKIAQQGNIHAFMVLTNKTLMQMATYFPQSYDELSQVSGFGKVKMDRYSKPFLEVMLEFCLSHSVESRMHLKTGKRETLPHDERIEFDNYSKRKTLRLFKEGTTPEEIAIIRQMSQRTIDVHLSYYIFSKELNVHELISAEKVMAIQKAIAESDGIIGNIKRALGRNYTYSEIRYVQATIRKEPVYTGSFG